MDNENTMDTSVDTVPPDGGDSFDTSTLPAAPVQQVVSVDELLERLTESAGNQGEADSDVTQEDDEEISIEPSLAEEYYAYVLQDTTGEQTVQLLEEIKAELEPHDLMTTNFADYTVSEGLLLLALLGGVVSACVKMLKGGFSWLSW